LAANAVAANACNPGGTSEEIAQLVLAVAEDRLKRRHATHVVRGTPSFPAQGIVC